MPHHVSVADSAALGRATSTLFACAAVIAEQTLPTLDAERHAGMVAVLAAGGWLAVEAAVDGVSAMRATLTVVDADGVRSEVASVHVPDRP
jgi:hypothetical protein